MTKEDESWNAFLNYLKVQLETYQNFPVALTLVLNKGTLSFYTLKRISKSDIQDLEIDEETTCGFLLKDKKQSGYIG